MPRLTKKAIRSGCTDRRTDPNYRKASLFKIKYDLKWYFYCIKKGMSSRIDIEYNYTWILVQRKDHLDC